MQAQLSAEFNMGKGIEMSLSAKPNLSAEIVRLLDDMLRYVEIEERQF